MNCTRKENYFSSTGKLNFSKALFSLCAQLFWVFLTAFKRYPANVKIPARRNIFHCTAKTALECCTENINPELSGGWMRATIGRYLSTPPALRIDHDINVSSPSWNLLEPAPKSTLKMSWFALKKRRLFTYSICKAFFRSDEGVAIGKRNALGTQRTIKESHTKAIASVYPDEFLLYAILKNRKEKLLEWSRRDGTHF